jgi:hypothetical protein
MDYCIILPNDQLFDSFDKVMYTTLVDHFSKKGRRNNHVYIKVIGLTTNQRYILHTYQKSGLLIYSVGEVDVLGKRDMIIEFKAKYITNLLKQ